MFRFLFSSKPFPRYHQTLIFLHWLMALLVFGVWVGGIAAEYQTYPLKGSLFFWHKSFGLLILLLVFWRIFVRFSYRLPPSSLPKGKENWKRLLRRVTTNVLYFGFYLLLLLLPLSGLLGSTVGGKPVSFFGIFSIPSLAVPIPEIARQLFSFHKAFAFFLLVFVLLHLSAVLKQHFVDKNGLLLRMSFFKKKSSSS